MLSARKRRMSSVVPFSGRTFEGDVRAGTGEGWYANVDARRHLMRARIEGYDRAGPW